MLLIKHFKKLIAASAIAMVSSFFMLPLLQAQQGGGGLAEAYLKKIMENTFGILQAVDELPSVLDELYKLAVSWNSTKPDAVAQLQSDFARYGSLILQNLNTQLSIQPSLTADLFKDVTPATLSYANDLAFQTLLGMPIFRQDPRKQQNPNAPAFDPKINYIKNAAGITLNHYIPERYMNGREGDVLAYRNYYNAVKSVESYNAYILSGLYADYEVQDDPNSQNPQDRNKSLSSIQNTLVSQASSSDWFVKVASEELGLVLRQLLMYESQVFVLMTQLIQTQKQMLALIAMNNTLTIAANTTNEQNLYDKATRKIPGT